MRNTHIAAGESDFGWASSGVVAYWIALPIVHLVAIGLFTRSLSSDRNK